MVSGDPIGCRVHPTTGLIMQDTRSVHGKKDSRRIARGVRMSAELWAFVDWQAEETGEGNASRMIERWVAEKRDERRAA